jgi:hypothetical protein
MLNPISNKDHSEEFQKKGKPKTERLKKRNKENALESSLQEPQETPSLEPDVPSKTPPKRSKSVSFERSQEEVASSSTSSQKIKTEQGSSSTRVKSIKTEPGSSSSTRVKSITFEALPPQEKTKAELGSSSSTRVKSIKTEPGSSSSTRVKSITFEAVSQEDPQKKKREGALEGEPKTKEKVKENPLESKPQEPEEGKEGEEKEEGQSAEIQSLTAKQKKIMLIGATVFVSLLVVVFVGTSLRNRSIQAKFLEEQQKQEEALRQSQKRFVYWWNELKKDKVEKQQYEQAVEELAQLKQKEVLMRFIEVLLEGKSYFLQNTHRTSIRDEYYKTFAKALGKQGQPSAGKHLWRVLQEMKGYLAPLPPNRRPLDDITYMLVVAQAIADSGALNMAKEFAELRWQMGQVGEFWERSGKIYEQLATLDGLDKDAPVTAGGFLLQGRTKFFTKRL